MRVRCHYHRRSLQRAGGDDDVRAGNQLAVAVELPDQIRRIWPESGVGAAGDVQFLGIVAGEDGLCHALGLALAAVGLDQLFQG